jgi:hypothetical protein
MYVPVREFPDWTALDGLDWFRGEWGGMGRVVLRERERMLIWVVREGINSRGWNSITLGRVIRN